MDASEFDPLDDIFADETAKKVRPTGRFQPKLKKKGLAASKTAKPLEDGKKDLASELNSVSCEDDPGRNNNADVIVGLDTLGEFPPGNSTNTGGSASVSVSEDPTPNFPTTCPELPVDEDPFSAANPITSITDGCDSLNKDLEIDIIDALDISAPTTTSGKKTGKFHPRPKTQKQDNVLEANASVSSYSLGSESIPPDTTVGDKDSIPTTLQDDFREQIDIMDALGMSATETTHGQKTGKFKPKPKKQKQNQMQEDNASVPVSLGSEPVPPETSIGDEDQIPILQDDVIDLSLLGFADTSPGETTSEFPLNDTYQNNMETDHLFSNQHEERVPEIPEKLATRRAKSGNYVHTASDPSSEQHEASTSNQDNESGRSLRPRKFNQSYTELGDEEVIGNAPTLEENIDTVSESQKKKAKCKSKKPGDDKENPSKKRKAKETSDQDAPKKPKKFSHSTRRRRVDKALLETPEDELDHEKVPLRDLILLAEHREREMKKEEAAAKASATKQSNGNTSERNSEEGTFVSKQDGDYDEAEPSQEIPQDTEYFNYQTFMDRTPARRWSKQETELFYEAIQQFGTDLSMIQQLFPGRTRGQIKSKYKKEERQHPLRLRDALTSRSTNKSHFQKVIDHLKQLAADQAKQNAGEEETVDLTGEEEAAAAEDEIPQANDEEAKDENSEEKENEDVAASDDIAVGTECPPKADDDDDDVDFDFV